MSAVLDERERREHHLARARGAPLLFWGHRARADGRVSESCLSQWWPGAFAVDGATYPTAEHFMMARKALLFGATSELVERIRSAGSPKDAKALGRTVPGFDAAHWERHRFGIVVEGNLAKFSQDEALRRFLLSTEERLIVEASPRDVIWGVGLGASNPRAADPAEWRGLNLLGFALMEVRERLRA